MKNLRKPDDRIQGRSQLMADIGEKFQFRAVRHLRILLRKEQLRLDGASFGDIRKTRYVPAAIHRRPLDEEEFTIRAPTFLDSMKIASEIMLLALRRVLRRIVITELVLYGEIVNEVIRAAAVAPGRIVAGIFDIFLVPRDEFQILVVDTDTLFDSLKGPL